MRRSNPGAARSELAIWITLPLWEGDPGGERNALYLPHGHFTVGGMEDRIEFTLPPVLRPNTVPRS